MELDQDTLSKVLCGPGSVSSVVSDIHKVIEHKKTEIIKRQAEIATLVVIHKTLSSLRDAWLNGGPPSAVEPSSNRDDVIAMVNVKAHEDFLGEIIIRREAGTCTFKFSKARGGDWCQGLLKTEEEKEAGYCTDCLPKMRSADG